MHRVFQRFIDGLVANADAEGLRAVLAEASTALDLSCFAYLSLPTLRSNDPLLISNYPVEWTDHYLHQRYERVDPVIIEALATPEPFEWGHEFSLKSLSKPQQALLDEAAQFGIHCANSRSARPNRGGHIRYRRAPCEFSAMHRATPARRPAHGNVLSCAC